MDDGLINRLAAGAAEEIFVGRKTTYSVYHVGVFGSGPLRGKDDEEFDV